MKRDIYIKIFIILVLSSLLLLQLFNDKKDIKKDKSNNRLDINESKDNDVVEKETYGNTDIIGNIKIDGTSIDEYIVKTTDNEYYLNHNLKKEEDIAGSVFMDYRNHIDDRKILIFGHNARKLDTVPFHDLEKYLDKDFYDKYKYIDLKLGEDSSKWIIFSVMIVEKGDNTHMQLDFNDNTFIKHVNYLKENSIYDTLVDVNVNDKIVVIQTCNYNPENTYILICAKKVY